MHHFIYPAQDTFITNQNGYDQLNFGIDEILYVGTNTAVVNVISPTTTVPISQSVTNLCVVDFSGSITDASLYGTSSFAVADVTSSVISIFSTSNFTGFITGSPYTNFSGSISGSFSGSISGSFLTTYVDYFNGVVDDFTGKIIEGFVSGEQILPQQTTTTSTNNFTNRALVQFDINSISQSISNGDIVNPIFTLKLKVAREQELPIQYNIYAFPISESWVMGDGYYSDGGSSNGASWTYRDYQNGTLWDTTGSTYISSMVITESFNYQVGDIDMDITSIAMSWISGTVANNGIVLISSDEFSTSPTGMQLYFFSKDTNTIYEPILDVAWSDFSWSTGSTSIVGINTSSISPGLYGTVINSASMSSGLYGRFLGIGNIYTSSSISYSIDTSSITTQSFYTGISSGLVSAIGTSNLIYSMSIVGNFSGSYTSSIVTIYKRCKTCRPINPDLVYESDVTYNEQVSGIPFNLHPFYPGAGDDANYSVYPGTPTDADFYVIDGQFPSQYNQPLNIPSFIQAGLAYMDNDGGLNQCQYEGHDIYGWGHKYDTFNQYDWWSKGVSQNEFGSSSIFLDCDGNPVVTMSFVMGTFIDGLFSGSTFTSSLINNYILARGWLTGSWNEGMIIGTNISASYPLLPMYPNAVNVSFSGPFINGKAFGSLSQLSQSVSSSFIDSGIFNGTFTTGIYAGTTIYAPFSGSMLTSSYFYTGSIITISSSLSPIDLQKSFKATIQNLPTTIHAGDIIKIKVFGRPLFPLKNFNRQTQFEQFLIPQYLPTSSYYAIKDNETEEIILDFDQFTQISCDSNGNYFLLDTTSYPQERYFRIIIKVEENGQVYTFDNNNVFKIVR